MATKSILKNINIRTKRGCRTFISALENAGNKKSKDVHLSKPCREIKGEDLKKIFGSQ